MLLLPSLLLATVLAPAYAAGDAPAAHPRAAAAPAGATDDAVARGLAAYKRRHYKAAEQEFRKAIEANANRADAHWYLGYVIYKQVEPKKPFHPDKAKAAEEFAKAYQLDPQFKPTF